MKRSGNWMGSEEEAQSEGSALEIRADDQMGSLEVHQALEAWGFNAADEDPVAGTLARRIEGRSAQEADLLLEGATLVLEQIGAAEKRLTRSQGHVDTVERWLEDFKLEATKLDETVKVLSAYLYRMRKVDMDRTRKALQ